MTQLAHPLLLVCTHGKHDACCAKYGLPVYEAMRDLVDEGWLWQCSHVGGDRFAGNVVCLPEGVYYGRVGAGDALALVEEHLAGRVQLDLYRGRSCYSFRVQAAERAVRASSRRARPGRARASLDVADRLQGRRDGVRGRGRGGARRARPADVQRRRAQPSAALRRTNPSRISRLSRTSRLSASSSPGSSSARNGALRLGDRPQLRDSPFGHANALSLEDEGAVLELRQHRRPPLQQRLGGQRIGGAELGQRVLEHRPARAHELRAAAPNDVVGLEPRLERR